MPDPQPDPPKIFVDEDWKSRVAAEKESLAAQSAAKPAEMETDMAAGPPAPETAKSADASESVQAPAQPGKTARAETPAPPATLAFLVTTLATQAMVALGDMTHPLTNKNEVRLTEARHFIDVLDMLEEKTAGNRTPEVSALLDALLHQLRLSYVERKSHGSPNS